jgi:hypothetical protein
LFDINDAGIRSTRRGEPPMNNRLQEDLMYVSVGALVLILVVVVVVMAVRR